MDRDFLLAFDSIWLIDGTTTGTLTRWDLATRQVLATIKVGNPFLTPYGDPVAAVATSEAVWVTSVATHEVMRIDPAGNQITERIPLGQVEGQDFTTYAMVGNDPDPVRMGLQSQSDLADRSQDQAGGTSPFPGKARESGGWVTMGLGCSSSRSGAPSPADRSDRRKGACRIPLDTVDPNKPLLINSLWFAAGDYVYRVDPVADQVVARIDAGATAYHVTDTVNAIWVTISPDPAACRDLNQGTILQMDPGTNSIVGETSLDCPSGMLPYDNNLWVMNNDGEVNGQNGSRFSILQP